MRRTNTIEIFILGKETAHFVGPGNELNRVMAALGRTSLRRIDSQSEPIPWDKLAQDRIRSHSKPGLALRGARIRMGLTQQQLGRKIGVSQYNISKMEKGNREIGKAMAHRLAKFLNIDYRLFL